MKKILSAAGLKKYFPMRSGVFLQITGYVKALEAVDFEIGEGETVGIVGESGCGKSTLGRTVVKIYEPTAGTITYHDPNGKSHDISRGLHRGVRQTFRKDVQMIFQNPFDSLDPRMTIRDVIREPLETHRLFDDATEMDERVAELLSRVGLYPEYARRYPHEFSGGQRQRIAIARSIAVNPRLLICDEPTSALDVSVQSQIINLLKEIQSETNMALIFISHNLDLVHHMSDRIMVMYLGNVVESAPAAELFDAPAHPYTRALMSAVPSWDPKDRKLGAVKLEGEPPSPINPPKGCPFHPRCPQAMEVCTRVKPEACEVREGHVCACHLHTR
ncbi:MAG: ABC transporter ATP-binding protein [Firmicutes bacterium]|jgi:oligopeptide/dipeptide ABC transporter ATP-binding protein|nr:ABC transporter ATP-binding protein [Bacillota bacterium]MDH7496712.1 ABC transporter ATP-binding protein [Bacillota bacterium]